MNIYSWLIAPFIDYEFMRRALSGVYALSLGAAPLGVFLMWRRMSLMGDAMSHAILPGVAAGFFFSGLSLTAMTIGGVVTGLSIALLAGLVARLTPLHEDASFAAFYLISLGLGVTLVSLRGSNMDLLHVLFGTVLGLNNAALLLVSSCATITMIVLAVIYRLLIAECLDPGFLRVLSKGGAWVHMGFLTLVVWNLVAGFQVLGTLLVVGIMMLPAASARFWGATIASQIGLACLISIGASTIGLLLSYHYHLPASPAIILAAGMIYLASVLGGKQGGLLLNLRRPLNQR